MAMQAARTFARSRFAAACDAAAVERWLGEGGRDVPQDREQTMANPQTPPNARARKGERERAIERSIDNVDQNATEEALAAQSASDAEDREAESPADEGGEA